MGELPTLEIKDVFNKERDPLRKLNTIIQVIDSSEKSIWTEFEEFVLTNTLLTQLNDFIKDFSSSIIFDTPKRPIWLEGFYGSGKSHFAKIVGLLIKNQSLKNPNTDEVVPSIEFFVSRTLYEHKTVDQTTVRYKNELTENLTLFPKKIQATSLFINLAKYSKSELSSEDHLQSFSTALLREFNAFLGLSAEIYMAEVEKNLMSENLYKRFLAEVENFTNKKWEDIRKSTPKARITFIQVYTKLANVSETIAVNYMKGAEDDVKQKNIDSVLAEINTWIKNKLGDPKEAKLSKLLIVFDEAGIFFSSAENRIGELQSAAEWVTNPENKSHINMIFTAQQSLRKHLEQAKTLPDFHKAEQRFQNWFLGKENIKTVVVNRWLKKDTGGEGKQLQTMIESNYPLLNDGTVFETIFDTEMDYQKPSWEMMFESYPFLPYQFPMMIKITQGLIDRKIVREEYGGKTRSILSMTRDVLDNKSPFTKNFHFINDPFGSFVNLAQIYDSIIYTLRRKEEDQTSLVEKTINLLEDPSEFTEEERDLPISFQHVTKALFLLDFIDEIYSDELNIAKALFHSISTRKNLYYEKVVKSLEVLKRLGYVNKRLREITEKKTGDKREIWEYKIATEDEKKFAEYSIGIPVGDKDIEKTFIDLFDSKKGQAHKLIATIDTYNINKLITPAKEEYKLSESVKLKIKWLIDPEIDEKLTEEIENSPQNEATIIILSYRRISSYDFDTLKRKLLLLSKKAYKKQKIIQIIFSSLNTSKDHVQQVKKRLTENLRQIFRITKSLSEFPGYKATLVPTFTQTLNDLEKDIVTILEKSFTDGSIFSGDGETTKIGINKLNGQIKDILKEIYSKINKYSYLGQMKVNKADIKAVLNWDPKKKQNMPKRYVQSKRNGYTILPLFTSKNDLQPNQTEQYSHIDREFKKKTDNNADIQISGEELLEVFKNPPYSWKENVIVILVSAMVRNAEWDSLKGSEIKSLEEEEFLNTFTKNFSDLRFKIAEKIDQKDLIIISEYLIDVFNKNIGSPGYGTIDQGIREVLSDFVQIIASEVSKFEQLEMNKKFIDQVEYLKSFSNKILDRKRQIERIKGFLDFIKKYLADEKKKEDFNQLRSILYRVKALSDNGKIDRYYNLKRFLEEIFREFSQTETVKVTNELQQVQVQGLDKLKNPDIFYEHKWEELWIQTKKLWFLYCDTYITLHKKLQEDIKTGTKRLEDHLRSDLLPKGQLMQFKKIFTCNKSRTTPESVEKENYACNSCKHTYSVLKVKEGNIKTNVAELISFLDNITEGEDAPPLPPDERELTWEAYREHHSNIEQLIGKINHQDELFSSVENIETIVKESLKKVFTKHSSYPKEHTCSSEPMNWEIVKQACKECNMSYENLIDVFTDLEFAYQEIKDKIQEEMVEPLPYSVGIKIRLVTGEASDLEEFLDELKMEILQYVQKNKNKDQFKNKLLNIQFVIDSEGNN